MNNDNVVIDETTPLVTTASYIPEGTWFYGCPSHVDNGTDVAPGDYQLMLKIADRIVYVGKVTYCDFANQFIIHRYKPVKVHVTARNLT